MSRDPYKRTGNRSARRQDWDDSGDARRARSRARQELGKLDWLRVAIALFFGLLIFEFAFFCLFFLSNSTWMEQLQGPVAAFAVIILVGQIVLYGLAYLSLKRGDGMLFNWVLTLAILNTLLVIVGVVGFRLSLAFIVVDAWFFVNMLKFSPMVPWSRLFFTVGLWYCARVALRIDRIKRDNPEAFEGELEHGSATRGLAKRDREKARAQKRLIGIVCGILAVIAVGGFALWKASGPSNPKATIEEFEEAWNRGDRVAVAKMGRAGRASRWERNLKTIAKRKDWGEDLPRLSDPEWKSIQGERYQVVFQRDGGTVTIRLTWMEDRWCLTGLDPG